MSRDEVDSFQYKGEVAEGERRNPKCLLGFCHSDSVLDGGP